jgi:hypothetical protein
MIQFPDFRLNAEDTNYVAMVTNGLISKFLLSHLSIVMPFLKLTVEKERERMKYVVRN